MKRYAPGIKGDRLMSRWNRYATNKCAYVFHRAAFLKQFGILLKHWW